MFVTTLYFPKLDKYVQIICMIPYTIQGVILSVSILAAYVRSETFLSNRMVMLFGAYSVIIMPYIYQGIKNGMSAVNVHTLVEAAEMLGCSRIYAFFKVVVPNLISSVAVSSLLQWESFLEIMCWYVTLPELPSRICRSICTRP